MATHQPTVLITGCSRGGIGDALALEFAARGYHVFAGLRNPSKANDYTSSLTPSSSESSTAAGHVEVVTLDVTSSASIKSLVDDLSTRLPDGKLDVLVNNAGQGFSGPLIEADLDAARKLYEVNFWAPLAMAQAFLPMLVKAKGKVVNVSSVGSILTIPWIGAYERLFTSFSSLFFPFQKIFLQQKAHFEHTLPAYPYCCDQCFFTQHMDYFRYCILSTLLKPQDQNSHIPLLPTHTLGIYGSSKAALNSISETLRLELRPLGIKVITAMVGHISTNFDSNNSNWTGLPDTSHYKSIEAQISRTARGEIGNGKSKVEDLARQLVDDVVVGGGVEGGQVWRGKNAGVGRIVGYHFPTSLTVCSVLFVFFHGYPSFSRGQNDVRLLGLLCRFRSLTSIDRIHCWFLVVDWTSWQKMQMPSKSERISQQRMNGLQDSVRGRERAILSPQKVLQ